MTFPWPRKKMVFILVILVALAGTGAAWIFWRHSAPAGSSSTSTSPEDSVQSLMALPYLQGYYPAPETTGVTRFDPQRSEPGLNLFSSCHDNYAALIDERGTILHEWQFDAHELWPEEDFKDNCWEMVHLLENGDILAVNAHLGIARLDKDSRVVWKFPCNCHHDIAVTDSGDILTLTETELHFRDGRKVLDNGILKLSPDGKKIAEISFIGLLRQSDQPAAKELFAQITNLVSRGMEDVFHTNTVEWFDGTMASKEPKLFQRGNLLVCFLTPGAIGILNRDMTDFLWVLGPKLWRQGQHAPTLLPNGNILIFDNHHPLKKERSRILEFDPLTMKIAWSYEDDNFFSSTHGTVQRLDNGNTLITASDAGRAFEVTPSGEVVWEYVNPHRTGDNDDLIATLLFMHRIKRADAPWLTRR